MPSDLDFSDPPVAVAVATRKPRNQGGRPVKRAKPANPYVTSVHLGARIELARDGASARGVSLSHFIADAAELTAALDENTIRGLKALSVLRGIPLADIVARSLADTLSAARG